MCSGAHDQRDRRKARDTPRQEPTAGIAGKWDKWLGTFIHSLPHGDEGMSPSSYLACFCPARGGCQTWGPMTETDKNDLACNEYGFYPGSQQYDDCMKYVV